MVLVFTPHPYTSPGPPAQTTGVTHNAPLVAGPDPARRAQLGLLVQHKVCFPTGREAGLRPQRDAITLGISRLTMASGMGTETRLGGGDWQVVARGAPSGGGDGSVNWVVVVLCAIKGREMAIEIDAALATQSKTAKSKSHWV